MADLNNILRDALSLDIQERASLAEQLLASLDEIEPAELDRIWSDEAETRLRSIRSGAARLIPAELVHDKARTILERS
jgi:hypothetical protein